MIKHRAHTGANVTGVALTEGDVGALNDAMQYLSQLRQRKSKCPHCGREIVIRLPKLGAIATLLSQLLSKAGADITLHWKG